MMQKVVIYLTLFNLVIDALRLDLVARWIMTSDTANMTAIIRKEVPNMISNPILCSRLYKNSTIVASINQNVISFLETGHIGLFSFKLQRHCFFPSFVSVLCSDDMKLKSPFAHLLHR